VDDVDVSCPLLKASLGNAVINFDNALAELKFGYLRNM
jgi:hypothetical protein